MSHLNIWFPAKIALGAELDEESGEEDVELDSGIPVTNQRWASVRKTFNFAPIAMKGSDPDLIALRQLWRDARRSNSFNIEDFTDPTAPTVKVRFRTDLKIIAQGAGIYSIDSFTLMEDKSA